MSNKYDDGESRLNEYEVVKKIGNGRFGEVFLVKHKRTQEFFCWKAISYRGLKEREKSQLVIEVNVMRELKHKNIVRYIDRFLNKANQKLYILMEFCDAGDLSRNIQKCYKMFGKIEEHAIVDITRQLLQALAYCHNLKEGPNGERVLHRDLKPQNIFLSTGIRHIGKITAQANNLTSRPIAKIGDFGLSKNIGIESMAHSCVGTPYYWSPELLLHETKSYDDKSDMWALGCIIYELCSGKTPFHKANNFAQLVSELKKGPEFPLKGKSKELNFLVKSLLSLSPKDRPSALQCMGFQIIKQLAPPASSQASSAGSIRKESLMDQQKGKEHKENETAVGLYPSTTNQDAQMRNKGRQRSSSCLSRQNINTMRYRDEEVGGGGGGGTQRSNGIYEIDPDTLAEKEKMERNKMEREYAQRKAMEIKMMEKKMLERERMEKERIERERIERERIERERIERERMERERKERDRIERERIERMEREKIERMEREKIERMEREKIERMERLKRMEQERMEQIKRERIEKMERERIEEIERERDRERLTRERDRMSRDRLHSDRISRDRIDSERIIERDRIENERRDRYYTRNIESNSKLDMIDKMKLQSKNQDMYSNTRLKDKYDPPVSGTKNYRYGSRKSTYDDSEDYIDKGEVNPYMKKNSISNVSSKNISRYSNNSTTISNNYNNGVDGYAGYTNQSTISQYSNNSAESGKFKSTNPYQGRMMGSKNPKDIYSTNEPIESTYKSSKYEKGGNDMNNVCKSSRVSNVYFNDNARRSVSLLPPVHSTSRPRSSIYENNNTLREEKEYEIEGARESRNYKNMKDREYLLEQRKVLMEKKNEGYGIAKPNDNYDYIVASKCDSRYDPVKSMHRVSESSRRNRSMSVCTNDPTKKNSYRMKEECAIREDSDEYIMRNRNMYDMKNIPRNSKYEGNMYTCR